MILRLPTYAEIPGATFGSVDTFMNFQRHAVAEARRRVEALAARNWDAAGETTRARFASACGEEQVETAWLRAWWLAALGGRPRAPFEVGMPRARAETLMAALGEVDDRVWGRLALEVDDWWTGLLAWSRCQIAARTRARVAAAGRRLADDDLLSPAVAERLEDQVDLPLESRGAKPRKRLSNAARRRFAAAETLTLTLHRSLDRRFARLGPVCGACTRESGGCCSMTVPLIWRDADFRLMALGGAQPPQPADETAGACPFLGLEGCRLPSERRPHICRSFLCDRAEAALGEELGPARAEIDALTTARAQLGR